MRFCLSVGLVHGTHYLFDSKIFTRMCLSVGPQRLRFASFFIFGVAFVRLRFPFFFFFLIYLLRSVFYVRFCLSVGLVHGTYYLFDSKIFTRMCLSVGPSVYVLRPFFFKKRVSASKVFFQ